jgi:DNA modification methylase
MTRDSLFQSTIVPGKPGSGRLFDEELTAHDGPVTCLGMTFANDGDRRAWFTEQLREKLKDPKFRKVEGFPIGSDDDIIALSDPPFYTACPNPWLADFVADWRSTAPEPSGPYHREPFAADVSEGKYDPIYRLHPYHTKVPHKAIMRYILHYTEPGDVVFDGFCGTGMTGVAAQLCGNREAVMSLGYQVKHDGSIHKEEKDADGKSRWIAFSKLGCRRALLSDLSPAATFIGYNYNTPMDALRLEKKLLTALDEVACECGWMFETRHTDRSNGSIEYVIWSDVFSCPQCNQEIIFWRDAVDIPAGKVLSNFRCPGCKAALTKRSLERRYVTEYDPSLRSPKRFGKQVPVSVNYSVGSQRFSKTPDPDDLKLISEIEAMEQIDPHPTDRLPEGINTAQPVQSHGFDHVHHFYTRRNLAVLAAFRKRLTAQEMSAITAVALRITKRYGLTYQSGVWGAGGGPTNGTYYIPALVKELNMINMLKTAIKKQAEGRQSAVLRRDFGVIGTQSLEYSSCSDNTVDYVFIDPPFGANLNYSEINFIWESWLRVWTNNKGEAIENAIQGKGIDEYRKLMNSCFRQVYRILKPGRWVTIEFSNTSAAVWNNIQTALLDSGFIVANVSALDKQKGSFKALTTPTAVKQDLIISAYKPNGGFERRFVEEATTEEGVWDFVRTHLNYLPRTKMQGMELQFIPERDPRILFDQVIAYYVRRGYPIPVATSQEFQAGLAQRFVERDGMYFLPEQAAEYDRAKMQYGVPGEHLDTSVVDDEQTAIVWLRARLMRTPQVYSDIQPAFMPMLSHLKPNERELLSLELLLNQNFLCYDCAGPVPEQIHAYLSSNWKELRNLSKEDPGLRAKARDRWYVPDPNKAGDLEKLRDKALLKEFDVYKEAKKKLKVFRLEAVRAGFKKAWADRDYATIVAVADKIPSSVLEEDPKLLMWFDQATTRIGGDA